MGDFLLGLTYTKGAFDPAVPTSKLPGIIYFRRDMASSLTETIRVGFTYDSKAAWMARGFTAEECAEYDDDETIDVIAKTLTTLGYSVDRIGDVCALIQRLAMVKRNERCPWDVVFNICEGRNGTAGREGHVPSILESYAIPFMMSDSATLFLSLDKAKTKMVLEFSGISTAPFAVIRPGQSADDAIQQSPHRHRLHQQIPLFIKPSAEGSSKGISKMSKITDWGQLDEVVRSLQHKFPDQDLLLEKFLNGREFTVGIIGTGSDARALFVRETIYLQHTTKADHDMAQPITSENNADFYSFAIKALPKSHQGGVLSFRNSSDQLAMRAADLALRAYQCMGCRDVSRVDVRCDVIDPDLARPCIVELNPLPGLKSGYSELVEGARYAGVSYETLIGQIMDCALKRLGLR